MRRVLLTIKVPDRTKSRTRGCRFQGPMAQTPPYTPSSIRPCHVARTKIPASVLRPGILVLATWQGRIHEGVYGGVCAIGPWNLHPLVLLFVLSGTLMVSKTLRIRKL